MSITPSATFHQFLSKFPVIELPVILNDEAHHTFSTANSPLTEAMIRQFIAPWEAGAEDEFTEYVPCFQLPQTEGFHAIVYWKADLMSYLYTLATYTTKGQAIDRRVIAGTFVKGQTITQSVATINEEREIFVASGQSKVQDDAYDAATSTAYELELAPDGHILNT